MTRLRSATRMLLRIWMLHSRAPAQTRGIAAAFKKLTWTDFRGIRLRRKGNSLRNFIEEHGNLLTFYEKIGAPGSKGPIPANRSLLRPLLRISISGSAIKL